MAVEKAILFDELTKTGDDEERIELRRGGRGGRGRGGRGRGGRGRGGRGRGSRGRGSRSARGASARGARSRSRSRAGASQGRSRRGGAAPSGAQGRSRKGGAAPSGSRRPSGIGVSSTKKTTPKKTTSPRRPSGIGVSSTKKTTPKKTTSPRRPSGIGVSSTKKKEVAKVSAAPEVKSKPTSPTGPPKSVRRPSGIGVSSTKKTTTPSGPPRKDRFKTTEQTRKDIKDVEKRTRRINKEFDDRTAFKTSDGDFLRDSEGNIVRSKTQVDKFKEDQRRLKVARDIGLPTKTGPGGSQVMTPTDFARSNVLKNIRNQLGRGPQTPENLQRLMEINRQLGDFAYTGMGPINQFKTQGADVLAGLGDIPTPMNIVRKGLGLFGDDAPEGGIMDLFKRPEGEETSPTMMADRGGNRERRDPRSMPPGIPPGVIPTPLPPVDELPITGKPVDENILNEYLRLAGFSQDDFI
jgi:hypothetical protein